MRDEVGAGDIAEMIKAGNPVFESIAVLGRGFYPEKVLHRERELREIASSIDPSAPFSVLVSGSFGTGKSTAARAVRRGLMQVGARVYLLSADGLSEYGLLRRIALAASGRERMERSKSAAWESVRASGEEGPLILILDDVRWNAFTPGLLSRLESAKGISVLALTREALPPAEGDYNPIFLELRGYTQNQLRDILGYHAIHLGAFKKGVIREEEVALCANLTYGSLGGDCKKGLELLRRAGAVLASELREGARSVAQVVPEHLYAALEEMQFSGLGVDDADEVIPLILAGVGGSCRLSRLIRIYGTLEREGVFVPSRSTIWRRIHELSSRRVVSVSGTGGRGNPKAVKLLPSKERVIELISRRRGEGYARGIISVVEGVTRQRE